MNCSAEKPLEVPDHPPENLQLRSYAFLRSRFVLLLIVCSTLPLLFVGWVLYYKYSTLTSDLMLESFRSKVVLHKERIETFLNERVNDLELITRTHSSEFLQTPSQFKTVFDSLNRRKNFFEDLGIINMEGKHQAYVGPFDLWANDYSETFWFKRVMIKGRYISDVFLGYRNVPHFVIAVSRVDEQGALILRGTIDADQFLSIVEGEKIAKTGAVYLLNKEGRYQTRPRFGGRIMEEASLPISILRGESGVQILYEETDQETTSPKLVVGYMWLSEPRWLLVFQQDYAEAYKEIQDNSLATLIFIHLCVLVIVAVAIGTAHYMISSIKNQDLELSQVNQQLLRASKLASVGELAAGVAHEINNPLAVVLSESQVIRDLAEDTPALDGSFNADLLESLTQIESQVKRCKVITSSLLRFSYCGSGSNEPTDVNWCLENCIFLLEKKAKSSGIRFCVDLAANLPTLKSDCSQLEQVFINLLNNAIDAHEGKPYGVVNISSIYNPDRGAIEISVADTGSGIAPDILGKIFDPFFTTKTIGKGTGLGLSISYSIVRHLGGKITVDSEVGKGTRFKVSVPTNSAVGA